MRAGIISKFKMFHDGSSAELSRLCKSVLSDVPREAQYSLATPSAMRAEKRENEMRYSHKLRDCYGIWIVSNRSLIFTDGLLAASGVNAKTGHNTRVPDYTLTMREKLSD